MCDLDYFKQINDLYGHNTGDAVLKETSNIIRNSVRSPDLGIRFGGEEFLVVLLDIKGGKTTTIAEKIRTSVESAKLESPRRGHQKDDQSGHQRVPDRHRQFLAGHQVRRCRPVQGKGRRPEQSPPGLLRICGRKSSSDGPLRKFLRIFGGTYSRSTPLL